MRARVRRAYHSPRNDDITREQLVRRLQEAAATLLQHLGSPDSFVVPLPVGGVIAVGFEESLRAAAGEAPRVTH